MSRDWTPRELFTLDRFMTKERGESLRDAELEWYDKDGNKIENENEKIRKTTKKRYPELTFLFDGFPRLYTRHHDKEHLEYYDKIEGIIRTLESEAYPRTDEEIFVQKWFTGKLDRDYYYNLHNNQEFEDYLDEHLSSLSLEKSLSEVKSKNKNETERD